MLDIDYRHLPYGLGVFIKKTGQHSYSITKSHSVLLIFIIMTDEERTQQEFEDYVEEQLEWQAEVNRGR